MQIGKGLRLGRQVHGRFAGFAAFKQAIGREAGPACLHVLLQYLGLISALRPGFEHSQPFSAFFVTQLAAIPARLVVLQLRLDPAEQVVGFFNPALLEHCQLCLALGQRMSKHLRQRADCGVGQGHGHQGPHVFVECGHIAPNALHLRHQGRGHGVELLPPVVLHRFEAQRGFVTDQLFFKQAAAVKRVFAQHALAPGIDGVDRRIVHGLRSQRQPIGRLFARLALGKFALELRQKSIVCFGNAAKHLRRFGQTGADAVRQFAGGRAGEGHHQHVLRQHGPHRCCALTAVAQDQAHIQGGNGPGLARACTGLDQVAAAQRKPVGVQGVGGHAACPSSLARASGKGSTCACAAQALSGAYTASAKRPRACVASKSASVG